VQSELQSATCLRLALHFMPMESKLANEAKLALLAATRRLTPEQRLNAFLAHCQLMMELYAAGQKLRAAPETLRSENNGPWANTLAAHRRNESNVLGNCTN
jgi:hypothetical protein